MLTDGFTVFELWDGSVKGRKGKPSSWSLHYVIMKYQRILCQTFYLCICQLNANIRLTTMSANLVVWVHIKWSYLLPCIFLQMILLHKLLKAYVANMVNHTTVTMQRI